MPRTTPFVTLLAAAMVLASSAGTGHATSLSGPRSVTISNNRGGYVVDYAIRMEQWKKSGTRVRFAGRCQSACTVYLALPASQTCIARGASFSFHAPSGGSSPSANRYAEMYMINTYPAWVRSWVRSKGGLSRRLVTMNYEYASRYMRACRAA